MKNRILILAVLLTASSLFAQVGIGTSAPATSSALDVTSTTKGFLLPRMTEVQRNAIATPATGLQVYCTDCGFTGGEPEYFNGTTWVNMIGGPVLSKWPANYVHCNPSNPTLTVDVYNPTTGKTWMDRNLGASQIASSSSDALSFGDLYQWGRFADGHQCRNSTTTTSLSESDLPGNGNFITTNTSPFDWRSPQEDNL